MIAFKNKFGLSSGKQMIEKNVVIWFEQWSNYFKFLKY